jgi:DMSO/TMAO reductase YedYZ molybdopterin-dependent catalytic subunit
LNRRRVFTFLLALTCIAIALSSIVIYSKPQTVAQNGEDSEPLLLIDGLVRWPLNLTYEEILTMPQTTVNAELHCVDAPATTIAKGNWSGVKLSLLLQITAASPKSVKVAFTAKDGYTTDLPTTTASRDDIIIAYKLNGQPLPEKPRLVVPGKWGYKWISQLTHVQLVDYDFKGFYESRGYSDAADMPPTS